MEQVRPCPVQWSFVGHNIHCTELTWTRDTFSTGTVTSHNLYWGLLCEAYEVGVLFEAYEVGVLFEAYEVGVLCIAYVVGLLCQV